MVDVEKKPTIASVTGGLFILIGVVGFIIVVISFDYEYYNQIKNLKLTYADEIEFMQDELFVTWIIGLGVLIINVAIGAILLTLDKIAHLLAYQLNSKELKSKEQSGQSEQHKETS